MRFFDNKPINEPSIGVYLEEGDSVEDLFDNCFYLLEPSGSSLVREAGRIMNEFNADNPADRFWNRYELETICTLTLDNHPKLRSLIEEQGLNLLIQFTIPGPAGKRFLVAHVQEYNLYRDLGLMIYESERISKKAWAEEVRRLMFGKFELLELLAQDRFSDRDFRTSYQAGLAGQMMMHPVFGMASTTIGAIKDALQIDDVITHRRQQELLNEFLDNCKNYRKSPDPQTEAKIDYFFMHIDPQTWKRFFLSQSPQMWEKMFCYVNPRKQAEVSDVNLVVKKFGKMQRNDGFYRLFMEREEERLLVHFQRKNSCIIYFIYLLDRKIRGDQVDTLDLSQYRNQFSALYNMVYGCGGEQSFVDMMKHYNCNNEVQQRELNVMLSTMRTDVGSTCERLREPPEPFLIRSFSSHLTVLPERIILPSEMIDLMLK